MKTKIKRKKINSIIGYILLYLSIILFFTTNYVLVCYDNLSIEQIIYTITYSSGSNNDVVINGIIYVTIRVLIVTMIIIITRVISLKLNVISLVIKGKRRRTINLFPIRIGILNSIVILLLSLNYISTSFSLKEYFSSQNTNSDFIEMNYIDPRKANIFFPENKKNLIYIFAESMESSLFDRGSGGLKDGSVIPKLESLASTYTSFSGTNKLGGAYALTGATWSIAGNVAETAGLPLKIPVDKNSYGNYSKFLPWAVTLGDILEKNGYNNYFLLGSSKYFAGKDKLFGQHGNYSIYGHEDAINEGKISANYNVWWGYEDLKLFSYAKDPLSSIANNNEPFTYMIETSDTHFTDGYMDDSCDRTKFSDKYSNAYYCSDTKIYNFIKWCQKQSWYDNTVIMIVGDHLSMQSGYYDTKDDLNRRVYNVIINSSVEAKNTNNRLFSTMDIFPTTLASLGVNIEGDRLGLGVNLYSSKKTLLEQYGVDFVNKELANNSEFYNV